MAELLNEHAVLHVRYDGQSLDIPLDELDLATGFDDRTLKRALAGRLEVPEGELRDYIVDRHQTGNLTIRPEAVFG